MTINRHLINDFDIVRPAQTMDKGLPLPFLSTRYEVQEGWVAVITEGGAFKEILAPGAHFLGKYKLFRDVRSTEVDTRIKTLTIKTEREFTIDKPTQVDINLDLAVEYRVADPRRVALEISSPLTSLYDRVIQCVREAVVYATHEEIRTQGQGIARVTHQNLLAMQLPKVIGIEVINVLVTSIKATDAGTDSLGQLKSAGFSRITEWQVENEILSRSQITPQWLMVNRPDIYTQYMAGNFEVVKELIDKGLLDPAGILNQTPGAAGYDPNAMLNQLLSGGMTGLLGGNNQNSQIPQGANGTYGGTQRNQLPAHSQPASIHDRMREEIRLIEKLPGVRVEFKPGTDNHGIPDNSYDGMVQVPRGSGGKIAIYFTCLETYPQSPPVVDVELNGEPVPFQSAILRRWSSQYLIEIVHEVRQYYV